LFAFIVGVVGGFARLAADLVMRDDGAGVTTLKQQLYHRLISQAQFDAAVAPIRARHGWVFDFWNINWLYYTQILLVVTAAILIVVSLLTKPPAPGVLKYTWYGASAQERSATRASWDARDVILSLIVLAAVVLFYVKFW
jgi:SSS family solute:Na+ symporter